MRENRRCRLVAYLVPRQRSTLSIAEVRQFLQTQVPEYMIPTVFVLMDELPLTANGKVDRRKLPEPQEHIQRMTEDYVEPRGLLEEMLVETWKNILHVKRVGIHNNFFLLGGHSLLATQIISRIRIIFQVDLPIASLFESPTIAEFAVRIEQALRKEQGVDTAPIVPVSRDQILPLSFAQQRLWFLNQLEASSSSYNVPHAVRMQGRLNVAALERSLAQIIQRHENLRTTFRNQDGEAVQVIHGRTPIIGR